MRIHGFNLPTKKLLRTVTTAKKLTPKKTAKHGHDGQIDEPESCYARAQRFNWPLRKLLRTGTYGHNDQVDQSERGYIRTDAGVKTTDQNDAAYEHKDQVDQTASSILLRTDTTAKLPDQETATCGHKVLIDH